MIVLMSMWRNDEVKQLTTRVEHLLAKTCSSQLVRWLWLVGDCQDETHAALSRARDRSALQHLVTIVEHNTGIIGDDTETCRRRGSMSATAMFCHINSNDDYACFHESDLRSSPDVLDRLLENPLPVAGWPVIEFNGRRQFYDIWAYRTVTGAHFTSDSIAKFRFEVGSFGSVWLAPASMFRGRVLDETCVVGLCRQWRGEGAKLYVDPTIIIEQPVSLWRPM